ncbi:MAG TPA: glycerol-3-phosphate 1-O-acyltransferase PlsY [Gemmatimonadaceae bacterium]|nr:glycerol-3-phosphate 1-O-acyltransferase PlsY [Gemmatimonadaceae bacterium]
MRASPVVWLLAAYLLGGIPWAYVAGRLVRNIDLRRHGSGNLGATNVYRVLGAPAAAAVVLLDAAKGFVPAMYFARWTTSASPYWALAYGLAAIAGHVRTPYLLWKSGGKGVATGCGVFLALAPVPTLVAIAAWASVLRVWRYVSVASLSAAVVLVIALGFWDGVRTPVFALGVVVALFVAWTHRANLGRLRRGEEHRVGRRPAEGS